MRHSRTRFPGAILARSWLVALSALAACGGSNDFAGSVISPVPVPTQAAVRELVDALAATLNGAQEVPARPSGATGSGSVVINATSRQMSAVLTTSAIVGTDAHIHQAPSGINGPIVFPLVETPRGSGIWGATATLTEAQYNAFKAGDFYFNVHSLAFADGEIRGQISPQLAAGTTGTTAMGATGSRLVSTVNSTTTFVSALRGVQEVPPTLSTALGSGTLLIDPASRQLTAAIVTSGIAGTAAHIHEGVPGVNGPILIPLAEAVPGIGAWSGRATLTEAQYSALRAGNMYFNVHSAALPGGEIRGQIHPQLLSLAGVTGASGNTDTMPGTPSTMTVDTGLGSGATGIGTMVPLPPIPTSGTNTGASGIDMAARAR